MSGGGGGGGERKEASLASSEGGSLRQLSEHFEESTFTLRNLCSAVFYWRGLEALEDALNPFVKTHMQLRFGDGEEFEKA